MSELSYLRDELEDLRRRLDGLEDLVRQLNSDTVLQAQYDGFVAETTNTLDEFGESITMLNQAVLGAGGDAGRRLNQALGEKYTH